MKLVFYSGGDEVQNSCIDKSFVDLIGKKNPLVTFIPSSSYLAEQEFKTFIRHYSKYKIKKFLHFPVDIPFDQTLLNEVFKSDAIHLGGGNTFYFLNSLRRNNLIFQLKKFVERGGILTGLSAGAILMTENIETAGYPEFDRDENEVGLKNLSSLNLVDFLFFPHFRNSLRYDSAFKRFSKSKKKNIYACPDGSGVVVNGDEIRFLGRVFVFSQGCKITIN
jgi:dipeptidase E